MRMSLASVHYWKAIMVLRWFIIKEMGDGWHCVKEPAITYLKAVFWRPEAAEWYSHDSTIWISYTRFSSLLPDTPQLHFNFFNYWLSARGRKISGNDEINKSGCVQLFLPVSSNSHWPQGNLSGACILYKPYSIQGMAMRNPQVVFVSNEIKQFVYFTVLFIIQFFAMEN